VLLGIACPVFLSHRPEKARWLADDEQEWQTGELHRERCEVESVRTCSLLQSLYNPRVIALAVIYCGIAAASVGW
jgi:hypothetical protein